MRILKTKVDDPGLSLECAGRNMLVKCVTMLVSEKGLHEIAVQAIVEIAACFLVQDFQRNENGIANSSAREKPPPAKVFAGADVEFSDKGEVTGKRAPIVALFDGVEENGVIAGERGTEIRLKAVSEGHVCDVVPGVEIVGPEFTSEAHDGRSAELSKHISLDIEIKRNKLRKN